jgi:hypothetical protein
MPGSRASRSTTISPRRTVRAVQRSASAATCAVLAPRKSGTRASNASTMGMEHGLKKLRLIQIIVRSWRGSNGALTQVNSLAGTGQRLTQINTRPYPCARNAFVQRTNKWRTE